MQVVAGTLSAVLIPLPLLLAFASFTEPHPVSSFDTTASPYPPQWAKVPASLHDFPVREVQGRNVTIVDPWVYLDRLGLYKVLLESTQEYFADWGWNNTGNLLWGLPLQFGWQMTSGRLRDMRNSNHQDTQRVSPMSWWADMNYFLSVVPFLGALNSGILDPVKFPVLVLKPTNVTAELRDKFCTSVTECASRYAEATKRWTEFFVHLRDGASDRDDTVGYLWSGHITSLHTAMPLFRDNLALLSTPEMHFGRGWAQLVDFIAACHFQTNLNNTHAQQALALPSRILHSGDHPPFVPGFTEKVNAALFIINAQYDAQQLTEGGLLSVWQKAMCSEKGRADGRDMLLNLLEHPVTVAEDLVKLTVDFAKDHDC